METEEKIILFSKADIGKEFKRMFNISQEQINEFARILGDTNPLHLDPVYAATTRFKKPIMHGMIGAGVISSVFGTQMEGPVYLSQNLNFKHPMFVDTTYEATVTVKEINYEKNIAILSTDIFEKSTGTLCLKGEAVILNKKVSKI